MTNQYQEVGHLWDHSQGLGDRIRAAAEAVREVAMGLSGAERIKMSASLAGGIIPSPISDDDSGLSRMAICLAGLTPHDRMTVGRINGDVLRGAV